MHILNDGNPPRLRGTSCSYFTTQPRDHMEPQEQIPFVDYIQIHRRLRATRSEYWRCPAKESTPSPPRLLSDQ